MRELWVGERWKMRQLGVKGWGDNLLWGLHNQPTNIATNYMGLGGGIEDIQLDDFVGVIRPLPFIMDHVDVEGLGGRTSKMHLYFRDSQVSLLFLTHLECTNN